MAHTIELHKVSKYYANEDTVSMGFARLDLNLDIGEFVAITGESGSGKSTLLNVISGLDSYEEGEMFVCGEDTTAYDTEDYERYRKTYIGNIFQNFNLINSYTVYQNIETVMLLSGKKKGECREKIMELIDKVGLTEYARTKASRLSGGQKQRVAIARALAKDAPIIVADEPTGNLDSASAAGVMETLSNVAKDKLVVIVTHNYDQAEPYVTRKLTMHDGRIIEDKKFSDRTMNIESGMELTDQEPVAGKMRKTSELRLGLRNTFNIPAKFMLLFIVYLFVATAVLSQYASSTSSMHQSDLLGYNQYFTDSSSSRIVIKKADETALTDEDIETIENNPNIDYVIKNDITLDSGVNFSEEDLYFSASMYPLEQLDESEVMYGSAPQNDYEIVVKADQNSDAYWYLSEDPESYIGKTLTVQDSNMIETYQFSKPVKISGIIIDDSESDSDSDYYGYGYAEVYASDVINSKIQVSQLASSTRVNMDFNGTIVTSEDMKCVYESDKVPKGKAYIFEDESYYYKDAKAVGKKVSIDAENRFFSDDAEFTIDAVLTSKNFKKLLGLPNTDYDMYYNSIYINTEDYEKLFDKGYFQISAFMLHEEDSDTTASELQNEGFTTLVMKDSLTDVTGGYNAVLQLFSSVRLLVEFIILFYIAYAVIRLIMRSRNSYYSILRILGATKKNTDNILRIELIVMMLIAYGVDLLFVGLVKIGIIRIESIENMLYFLSFSDYVLLGIMLLAMSLLLARRYSRKIFTKSAMQAFRGEV